MRILGLETSCDDTGAAIYDTEQGLITHGLASQIALHTEYGGVVPELAARDHIRTLLPLVDSLLSAAANGGKPMHGVAWTMGPGLAGALLVGAAVGRSLSCAWGVPGIGVHHLEGHLLAVMLEPCRPEFPFVALLVSGGHTLLVDVAAVGDYKILGQSLDDAAGEAFDKTAKLLGLGYPGGPAIAKMALEGKPERFDFPRPMVNRAGLDFSFSGLKTYTRTIALEHGLSINCGQSNAAEVDAQTIADIACAFEHAVVDTLCIKSVRALKQTGRKCIVVAGGVGANRRLRQKLKLEAATVGAAVYYPKPEFCTDNGAMIAYAGSVRIAADSANRGYSFAVKPRWSIEQI